MTFGGRAGAQGESQRANKSRVLGLPVAVADDDDNNMQHVTIWLSSSNPTAFTCTWLGRAHGRTE
jgi:hypothetical protein